MYFLNQHFLLEFNPISMRLYFPLYPVLYPIQFFPICPEILLVKSHETTKM